MAEEVTYADLKFITLEQKKEVFQKNKTKVYHYWRPTAVTFGIVCLSLIGTVVTLSFKVMQASYVLSNQNENLTLQKKTLENLFTQLHILQAQKLNLSEIVKQLSNYRDYKCSPCPERWVQRGENCYFFSTKWNSWEESKAQCAALSSRLLKIESKEELEFILESAQAYNSFWIGLFHSRADGPWLWEDNSTFATDLYNIPDVSSSNYPTCVSILGGNLIASDCLGYRFCICEKVARQS
ncbi:oxidized low-density lipoprotein receptor 1 [Rhineura floridana]|uniref:oxidized low-density lipoprotein receptor 1 n=1 Tax=Rhineura floridana TaxID=261503 RepID=UPI002AC83A49|nr:oxidized low-density lipoprotein receptor 1 [Rhineura floridana]XP_061486432.1 oxidized low-density lipoprotein receptor 1 [Rhineura floridana]XP_061486500.1 oxidized low-density lipoprotein receptor 1 [Rhineura floridana]XP_061486556.1 oxidized low-density lipoprotein receptor 1 [Rhineura floridana]